MSSLVTSVTQWFADLPPLYKGVLVSLVAADVVFSYLYGPIGKYKKLCKAVCGKNCCGGGDAPTEDGKQKKKTN